MTTPEAKNAREFAARVAAKHINAGMFLVLNPTSGKFYAESGKWTTDKARAAKYGPRSYAEEIADALAKSELVSLELVEA